MGFELTASVVIGTDCMGSCKSNYHTITATTDPVFLYVVKFYVAIYLLLNYHLKVYDKIMCCYVIFC